MALVTKRAERALDRLQNKTNMTDEGKHWLIAAVDPFHDATIPIKGYPDMTEGASIVQCIKQTVTIRKPTTLGAVPWDCLVSTSPFKNHRTLTRHGFIGNSVGVSTSTFSVESGGLTAVGGAVGEDISVINTAGTQQLLTSLSYPPANARRRFRILAEGFEVHNVTPELFKGGTITVFEQTQALDKSAVIYRQDPPPVTSEKDEKIKEKRNSYRPEPLADQIIVGAFDAVLVEKLPLSTAQAQLLPGAKTWEAREGVYCVASQSSIYNPAKMVTFDQPIVSASPDDSFPDTGAGAVYLPEPVAEGACKVFNFNIETPFNTKGAYFSGLSPETVLTLNYNLWVERFPTQTDGDLVLLATPSAQYDPAALAAYAEIMTFLPVGCPVKENGLGDWFAGAVASIVDTVTGTKIGTGFNNWANQTFFSEPESEQIIPPNVWKSPTVQTPQAKPWGKMQKQGPRLPSGKLKSPQAAQLKREKRKAKKDRRKYLEAQAQILANKKT